MVQLRNVSKIYNNEFSVLTDVSFSVAKGEFVFLTGESSSGKSTLLKHIYMDEFPTSGTVKVSTYDSDTIKKRDIPFLRRSLGIVFQWTAVGMVVGAVGLALLKSRKRTA